MKNLNKKIDTCETDIFKCNAVIDTLSRMILKMKEGKEKERYKRMVIKVNDLKIQNQGLITLYKLEKQKDIVVEKRMTIEMWMIEEAIIKKYLKGETE